MTKEARQNAQDAIVGAAIAAALRSDECGDAEGAEAIRVLAARLAKQYGLNSVPGLPATFR